MTLKRLFSTSILILLFSFSVSSITSCEKKPDPVVYQCPRIHLPDDPPMLINRLTEKSEADEVMKSYVATVVGLRSWNQAVRKQVDDSY